MEQRVIKDILALSRASVVLDVGANIGQYGDLVLEAGFAGTLVSFEALPNVHHELVEHARKKHRSWIVAPCAALGSNRGQVEINVAANSVSSSILPMRRAHLAAAPQSRYVNKQTVNIERLDELAAGFLPPTGELLIKVDTQGYEMEVLKGATGLLQRTAALQLELSLMPMYDGAPTLVEMMSFVESKGYELFGIVPGFRDARSGRLLQVDGFFVRAGLSSCAPPIPAD